MKFFTFCAYIVHTQDTPSMPDNVNIFDLFNESVNITDAYMILRSHLDDILKSCDLLTLKGALISQVHTPDGVELGECLENKIDAAKSNFELLYALDKSGCCNWLDTRLIEVLSRASKSSIAVELIKAYQKCIHPKKFMDNLPKKLKHLETKLAYVTEVSAKIEMDPDTITVGDFKNYHWAIEDVILDLGKGILNIEHVEKGCLEIHYTMPIHCRFNAYKMALYNRYKFYTVDLINIEVGRHPLIYDPWFSDLKSHSTFQIMHDQCEGEWLYY